VPAAAIDAYFLDANAAVYAAGVWNFDRRTGWCLDAVMPPSYDCEHGWWLAAVLRPRAPVEHAAGNLYPTIPRAAITR
jgi:hypothetical protein